MQYLFFSLLEIISLLLALFLGTVLFYLLTKKWQGAKFLTALKAMLLYELAGFLIYLIYSFSPLYRILNSGTIFLRVLSALIFASVLFLVFYLMMKRFLSLSWKKSLAAFLLVVIIAFPLLDFFRISLDAKIVNLPIFAKENAKLEAEMMDYIKSFLSTAPLPEPEAFKIINKIEKATLSWPSDCIKSIVIASNQK